MSFDKKMASSYLCYPHHIYLFNPLNIAALRNIQLIVPDTLVDSMFMINAMTGTRTIVKPYQLRYVYLHIIDGIVVFFVQDEL